MSRIWSKLDTILEHMVDNVSTVETPQQQDDTSILIDKYNAAQAELKRAHNNIELAINRACGDLALQVRHKLDGLNISLNKYGCTIGYRHKTLTFKPNILDKVWVVSGNNQIFTSKFMAKYSPLMRLQNIDEISNAIVNYFKEYYRSLNEDISGNGIMLLEGSNKSTGDIMVWKSNLSIQIRQAVK